MRIKMFAFLTIALMWILAGCDKTGYLSHVASEAGHDTVSVTDEHAMMLPIVEVFIDSVIVVEHQTMRLLVTAHEDTSRTVVTNPSDIITGSVIEKHSSIVMAVAIDNDGIPIASVTLGQDDFVNDVDSFFDHAIISNAWLHEVVNAVVNIFTMICVPESSVCGSYILSVDTESGGYGIADIDEG